MAQYNGRSEQKRTRLADVIPVNTPFVFGFFTGDICNFKCKYCIQASLNSGIELQDKFLDWSTFIEVADSLKQFPNRIKKVLFSSMGEPLLNKNLPKMIAYLNANDVADAYEIVTNASVLTHELSRQLIDAGLTRLCVSIQGIIDQKYLDICQAKVKFANIVDELSYFYNYIKKSNKNCAVHIKTVDIALDDGEEKRFKEIFDGICDTLFIDSVVPSYPGIDYSEMCNDNIGLYGKGTIERKVCPSVFYTLYVLPNGDVVTCCDPPYPIVLGNIKNESLIDMWNGKRRKEFLRMQLQGNRHKHPVCQRCIQPNITDFKEDDLDEVAEILLKKI